MERQVLKNTYREETLPFTVRILCFRHTVRTRHIGLPYQVKSTTLTITSGEAEKEHALSEQISFDQRNGQTNCTGEKILNKQIFRKLLSESQKKF